MKNPPESPSRRYLYNPHLLGDEDLERGFIVRTGIFDSIVRDLKATRESSPPPHYLIVGQRGMGKSTLLRRIGLELRREPLRRRFVPLNFPEEQHVEVDCLSKFWLNCLDALADTLEAEKETGSADTLDGLIAEFSSFAGDEDEKERRTRLAFEEQTRLLGRRPVLLLDNFHLLLARLGDFDHQLRGFFSEPGAPILIGAAPTLPEYGRDHGKAFYDAFKPRVLHRLSLDEIREIVRRLGSGNPTVLNRLESHRPHLAALRDLTGGNPRTAHLLYDLFASGFSDDVFENLTGLIDGITPLYQSYLDQLSEQGQLIVGILAREMKPMTAQAVADRGHIKRSSVSPQLGRLESVGFVERVPLHGTKKEGYQITERFFNIWYVLRFGSRRDRNRLRLLASFLKDLYTPEELNQSARRLLTQASLSECRVELALSLPEAVDDPALGRELKAKAMLELVEKHKGIREDIANILDPEEIDAPVFELATLKTKLKEMVPAGAEMSPEEFAELVITTASLLPGARGSLNRNSLESASLDVDRFNELSGKIQALRDNDSRWFHRPFIEDAETWDWLCRKLKHGQFTSFEDPDQLEALLAERQSPTLVALLANIPDSEVKNGYPEPLVSRMLDVWLNQETETEKDPFMAAGAFGYWGWHLGALVACREQTRVQPDDKRAWKAMGYVLLANLERLKEAEKAFREVLRIDAEDVYAWIGLAATLGRQPERLSEAKIACREAIRLGPENSRAWSGFGDLLQHRLARYEESEAAYQRALQLDEENIAVWCLLGNLLYMHLGRHDEAEKAYRRAIELDPGNPHPWNALGNVLADFLNRLPEGHDAYLKSLECDPSQDAPRHNLAFLLRDRMDRPEEARSILTELRQPELWRDTQSLHQALFAAYEDNRGIVVDALKTAGEATGGRLPPESRDDWLRTAAVLLHLGLGTVAVDAFRDAKVAEGLLPFVEAMRAHIEGDRGYLRNIIPEARPAAEKIHDEIEKRRSLLPPPPRTP